MLDCENVVHHGWRLKAVCDQEFQMLTIVYPSLLSVLGLLYTATIDDAWPFQRPG
jgi:hypothetical protein